MKKHTSGKKARFVAKVKTARGNYKTRSFFFDIANEEEVETARARAGAQIIAWEKEFAFDLYYESIDLNEAAEEELLIGWLENCDHSGA